IAENATISNMRKPLWVGIGVLVILAVALHFALWYRAYTAPRITLTYTATLPTTMSTTTLTLTSPAFADGGLIPQKYACDGAGTSPPLAWSNVPTGTKSLVLIVEDPDVPKALKPDGLFVHWVLYGIPADAKGVPEGGVVGNPGENGAGGAEYRPPCPPKEYE